MSMQFWNCRMADPKLYALAFNVEMSQCHISTCHKNKFLLLWIIY